jgi:hypothetical protein
MIRELPNPRARSRPASLLTAAVLATVVLLATAAVAFGKDSSARSSASFVDRFATPRLDTAKWRYWWGSVAVRDRGAVLASPSPRKLSETRSALITTSRSWRDFSFAVAVQPLRQLRLNAPGNTWETGWVFFRFRDLENYYYFILKPNGWELGKKHGSDAQIFLATGSSPRLSIGRKARLRIAAVGSRIRVRVNGVRILDFTDPKPLRSGSVGLYEEDARVRFGPVTVTAR